MENKCQIPRKFSVGDTLSWVESWSDYPAPLYTLTLTLISTTGKQTVAASASGDGHEFVLDSANLLAGRYDYQLVATGAGYRSTIDRGYVTVEPDLAAADNFDGRDWVDKSIEAVQASLEGRASHVQLKQTFDGVSIEKMSQLEQMDLLDRLYSKRNARNIKKKLANGKSPFPTVKPRFRS